MILTICALAAFTEIIINSRKRKVLFSISLLVDKKLVCCDVQSLDEIAFSHIYKYFYTYVRGLPSNHELLVKNHLIEIRLRRKNV